MFRPLKFRNQRRQLVRCGCAGSVCGRRRKSAVFVRTKFEKTNGPYFLLHFSSIYLVISFAIRRTSNVIFVVAVFFGIRYFTLRRHQQCSSNRNLFVLFSFPADNSVKMKIWAGRAHFVQNPHNQMKREKKKTPEKRKQCTLLWNLERPLRTPCAIFQIQLAIFFSMAFFSHAKYGLLGGWQIEIWCEARFIVYPVLKGKSLLLYNGITWHSISIIYVWHFVSCFQPHFLPFPSSVEVALAFLFSEFRKFI